MKLTVWISQLRQDNTCFPVAVLNACLAKGVKPPSMAELIRASGCRHGGATTPIEAIELAGLCMEETNDQQLVYECGGILTLMHPIFNLHAVFCYPVDEHVCLVNSWLGPHELYIAPEAVDDFILEPGSPNCIHWYFVEDNR